MTSQPVYLYVTDTLADWEIGHAIAHIEKPGWQRAPGRYHVTTVGATPEPVRTMGGVRLVPDATLAEVRADHAAMLILPGADTWTASDAHTGVLTLAAGMLDAGVPVAAICGATFGLARSGLLEGRQHTSNARVFLQSSGYAAGSLYVERRAVSDGGLITASGCHPVEFAAEIFRTLELYDPAVLEAWHGLYTTGEERHFAALTAA